MCKTQDRYKQPQYYRVPLPKQFVPQSYWNWSEIDNKPVNLRKKSLFFELYWQIFQAVPFTGRNNCS